MTGALAGLAFEGERLFRRLTDLDPGALPTAGGFARIGASSSATTASASASTSRRSSATTSPRSCSTRSPDWRTREGDLLPEADVAAARRAEAPLRRRDRRRRLARARDRVLPREAPRREGRLHPREVVHRLGRIGPEHDHRPRELPHARGRGVLRRECPALRAALERARLQPHVLAARASDAGALGPRARTSCRSAPR